jgi:hypothetical protein
VKLRGDDMARGGYRPGSGPAKGTKYRPRGTKVSAKKKTDIPEDIAEKAAAFGMTPLEFMLKVMNDPTEDKDLRARMAVSAAPYIHARKGEAGTGKKDEAAERARQAGQGKFAAGRPPLRMVK